MRKLIYILFVVVFITVFLNSTSCKKTEVEEDKTKVEIKDSSACTTCDTCINYSIDDDDIGPFGTIKSPPLERFGPTFNPLNSNEFIYERIDHAENTGSLIKYNLLTKQEQVLLSNIQILDQAKWGANGWIIFAAWDRKIYKVKDNGDSLTKLTFNVPCLYPELIDNSTKIFYLVTERSADEGGNKIIDLNGKRIDSLDKNIFSISSSNQKDEIAGYFRYNQDKGIQIYNIKTKNIRTIFSYKRSTINPDDIFAINWHTQTNKIYYSKMKDGLYHINADGSGEKFIHRNCDTQFYNTLSVSPDGKKILVERININPDPQMKGRRIQTSDIFIMNSDGTDEMRVF